MTHNHPPSGNPTSLNAAASIFKLVVYTDTSILRAGCVVTAKRSKPLESGISLKYQQIMYAQIS